MLVAQLCPTLFDSMDFRLPGSSVHMISQARILEWVAVPSSRVSSRQGSNRSLLHCRQILYHLSHQGSPGINIYTLLYNVAQTAAVPGVSKESDSTEPLTLSLFICYPKLPVYPSPPQCVF